MTMKHYQPKRIQPSTNQFHKVIKDKLSQSGEQSAAYQAVSHLFQLAEGFYRTLDSHTSGAEKNLTPTQEHDLVSLTACYIQSIDPSPIEKIIQTDQTITDNERIVLNTALALFTTTAEASISALGRPYWIEPSAE